jgi:hypothetical protein
MGTTEVEKKKTTTVECESQPLLLLLHTTALPINSTTQTQKAAQEPKHKKYKVKRVPDVTAWRVLRLLMTWTTTRYRR